MDSSSDSPMTDRDQRLERTIAGYLEDVAQGKPVDTVRLIAEHPDLADDLRQFLDDHQRIARVANSSIAIHPAADNQPDALTRIYSSDNTPKSEQTISVSPSLFTPGPVDKSSDSFVGRFGDYELLHEIARGGMGVVYKARQVSLNRVVAIKMILRGNLAAREDIERFALEAKAVARLTHPQIVVIHDVGQHGEQHFYTMEFVEGRSLAELIRSGPVAPRTAAEYVEQVAKAIHFAHQNGVVHRDIKPSNVLIDESGRARVTDFGLAKHVDRGEELTLSGEILGTPAYMAPEQITNRRGEIGPACDIYGMGVLLYELLTGRVPFKGRDQFDTLLQVLDCEPQSPRKINSNVPRQLEMICLKCMDKDPQHRYASASELADDLAHYLAGDTISVTSPKLVDRLVRTLERSQFDREFHTWSRMLLHLAWISLATHVMIYFNRILDPPHPLADLIGIRIFEVVGMGAVLFAMRGRWFPPRGAPARQLLSLWSGYMIGSTALVVIAYLLTHSGATFNDLVAYPPMAVLASLLFMMLGSSYWGYCYVMGSVFLVLSIVMTFWLPVAPLIFGSAWAASLTILSVRLSHLAGKS
jgi:tRNA A-37 threonylcarbamoyl transferase component Bud32